MTQAAVLSPVVCLHNKALALQKADRVHNGPSGKAQAGGHLGQAWKDLPLSARLLGKEIEVHRQLLFGEAAGKDIGGDHGEPPRKAGQDVGIGDPQAVRIAAGNELYQPAFPETGHRPPDGIPGAAHQAGQTTEGNGAAKTAAVIAVGVLCKRQVGCQGPGWQPVLEYPVRQLDELHGAPPFRRHFSSEVIPILLRSAGHSVVGTQSCAFATAIMPSGDMVCRSYKLVFLYSIRVFFA